MVENIYPDKLSPEFVGFLSGRSGRGGREVVGWQLFGKAGWFEFETPPPGLKVRKFESLKV